MTKFDNFWQNFTKNFTFWQKKCCQNGNFCFTPFVMAGNDHNFSKNNFGKCFIPNPMYMDHIFFLNQKWQNFFGKISPKISLFDKKNVAKMAISVLPLLLWPGMTTIFSKNNFGKCFIPNPMYMDHIFFLNQKWQNLTIFGKISPPKKKIFGKKRYFFQKTKIFGREK